MHGVCPNIILDLSFHLQVEIKVEATDKGGNFIGWLFVDGVNLSLGLVEQGLAKVHFTAERSNFFGQMQKAQEAAKEAKLNVSSVILIDVNRKCSN